MTRQEFEHIAKTLRPRLLTVGRAFFGDNDTAEDIAQETLMRLWLLQERINLQIGVEPLAIRMAKNLCVSEWRKRQTRQAVSLVQEAVASETISQQLEARDDVALLRSAISRLAPTEQRLFRMRHELEMELAEITAVTGISPRSISAILSTAKRKLLEMTKKKGGSR